MSLLQACKRATLASQGPLFRATAVVSRGLAADSVTPKKEPSDIVAPVEPPRDVMAADMISGAPCTSFFESSSTRSANDL